MGKKIKLCGLLLVFMLAAPQAFSRQVPKTPVVSAKSAIVVDAKGQILFCKNPHLRLPPASTTKLMTALLALEKLPAWKKIPVSRRAANATPSRAGLTAGADYRAIDLVTACLVSSSNDAAIALAEAVGGSEAGFAAMMNEKAKKLGMNNTRFINASGLTVPGRKQYSTAYDLSRLMNAASKNRTLDQLMGITTTRITGSDRKSIFLKSHNKMLWRMPKFVKGKTGWTFASRHTFVGTDYSPRKKIMFAMLCSQKPWLDIEKLATFGLLIEGRK